MKLAWIWDNGIESPSYYMKDGNAYNWHTHEPYQKTHWVSSDCAIAFNNVTFLYGQGYFINWMDLYNHNLSLPDIDLDLILYTCERNGLDDEWEEKFKVKLLRKKYPNAKIIGMIKEIGSNFTGHVHPHRIPKRFTFLNECDGILINKIDDSLPEVQEIQNQVNHKINTSYPIQNINKFYDKFYSNEKENCIFAYVPNRMRSQGRTLDFAKYISKKYNLELRTKPNVQNFYQLSCEEFINLWSPCMYHFNLDPINTQPGHQCIQVANAGCIHIGGNNESHKILFPETATIDENILEEKFVEYLNNEEKRFEVLQYAWNNLNKYYSFDNARNRLNELYRYEN